MNLFGAFGYLRAGLEAAGLRPDQVTTAMELGRDTSSTAAPAASVYMVGTRLRRQSRKVRIDLSELPEPPPEAVGGQRHTLMGSITLFEITVRERSVGDIENLLARFLEYLMNTPLTDRAGNTYRVLGDGEEAEREREINIVWNDHTYSDHVTCTFTVPMPGLLWRDHPLLPIEIVVEYRLDGGHPDE